MVSSSSKSISNFFATRIRILRRVKRLRSAYPSDSINTALFGRSADTEMRANIGMKWGQRICSAYARSLSRVKILLRCRDSYSKGSSRLVAAIALDLLRLSRPITAPIYGSVYAHTCPIAAPLPARVYGLLLLLYMAYLCAYVWPIPAPMYGLYMRACRITRITSLKTTTL